MAEITREQIQTAVAKGYQQELALRRRQEAARKRQRDGELRASMVRAGKAKRRVTKLIRTYTGKAQTRAPILPIEPGDIMSGHYLSQEYLRERKEKHHGSLGIDHQLAFLRRGAEWLWKELVQLQLTPCLVLSETAEGQLQIVMEFAWPCLHPEAYNYLD